MLGVNQLDFINYCNALKGNYRKGVHKMETLLENPTHAKEFAKNLGGVSVVLGTPVGKEDRNSETLRSMLLASDVANDAVYTWMGQYYEFDSWDELLGDEDRCKAMMANELLWRALSASGVAMGKTVATLAGLSCSAYDDMSAVAASSTAMAAIEKSQVAKDAIAASDMATAKYAVGAAGLKPADYANMAAVAASQTAMAAVASSSTAMAAIIANSTALNAVVSSSAAMSAVAASQTARTAIEKSQTAKNAIAASDMATAKYAVGAAGLNPADYANMAAVASSQTAMAAIASSQTAMAAVASSQTAMAAVINNATALNAVVSSSTAMAAVINSEAARTALVSSSVARKALKASSLAVEMSLVSSDGQYWNSIGTKTMRGLILYTKAGNTDNAFTITKVDSTTLASNNNARNAATSGSTGYKDWLEAFPNSSWVLSSITFYAYYRTTKIKYIPC